MTKPIIYEHPLNERIRVMLRLEHLFSQASHFLVGTSPWDSRAFLDTLNEILDIFGRGDLKTELLKEIERATANLAQIQSQLQQFGGAHQVDDTRLQTILRTLERLGQNIHNFAGQFGQELREDEFIAMIRQRMSIPGGTCDFDLPAYHFWLAQPVAQRRADQNRWYQTLNPIRQSVELLLKLMRNSADPEPLEAVGGIYQQALRSHLPYQLLRVMVAPDLPWYVEVSGNRHRFTIRFRLPGADRSNTPETQVPFQLSCCSL